MSRPLTDSVLKDGDVGAAVDVEQLHHSKIIP